MKNLGHITASVLFFTFGIVQWNDPDPQLWISLYFYVAVCILLNIYTKVSKYPIAIGMLFTAFMLYNSIPDVMQWYADGMPSIVGSMKAESKYIELVREFFGLFISVATLIFYFIRAKKQS